MPLLGAEVADLAHGFVVGTVTVGPFGDDFERTAGPLGRNQQGSDYFLPGAFSGSWTLATVLSAGHVGSTVADWAAAVANLDPIEGNDFDVTYDYHPGASDDFIDFIWDYLDEHNYSFWEASKTGSGLYRLSAGTVINDASGNVAGYKTSGAHSIRVSRVGSVITVWMDGVQSFTGTAPEPNAGSHVFGFHQLQTDGYVSFFGDTAVAPA